MTDRFGAEIRFGGEICLVVMWFVEYDALIQGRTTLGIISSALELSIAILERSWMLESKASWPAKREVEAEDEVNPKSKHQV
jgi:hypothetical protein